MPLDESITAIDPDKSSDPNCTVNMISRIQTMYVTIVKNIVARFLKVNELKIAFLCIFITTYSLWYFLKNRQKTLFLQFSKVELRILSSMDRRSIFVGIYKLKEIRRLSKMDIITHKFT